MRLLTAQVIVTATRSSLNDVEFLHLDGRDVQQLTEAMLECSNLVSLSLSRNQLRAPLAPLARCSELWHIDLSYNQLVSLEGLQHFVALGSLKLAYNQIPAHELRWLQDIELVHLTLEGNPATVKPLEEVARQHIDDEATPTSRHVCASYRPGVLAVVPTPWTIDGQFVVAAERVAASHISAAVTVELDRLAAEAPASPNVNFQWSSGSWDVRASSKVGELASMHLNRIRDQPTAASPPESLDLFRLRYLVGTLPTPSASLSGGNGAAAGEASVALRGYIEEDASRCNSFIARQVYGHKPPEWPRLYLQELNALDREVRLDVLSALAADLMYGPVPQQVLGGALVILAAATLGSAIAQDIAALPSFGKTALCFALRSQLQADVDAVPGGYLLSSDPAKLRLLGALQFVLAPPAPRLFPAAAVAEEGGNGGDTEDAISEGSGDRLSAAASFARHAALVLSRAPACPALTAFSHLDSASQRTYDALQPLLRVAGFAAVDLQYANGRKSPTALIADPHRPYERPWACSSNAKGVDEQGGGLSPEAGGGMTLGNEGEAYSDNYRELLDQYRDEFGEDLDDGQFFDDKEKVDMAEDDEANNLLHARTPKVGERVQRGERDFAYVTWVSEDGSAVKAAGKYDPGAAQPTLLRRELVWEPRGWWVHVATLVEKQRRHAAGKTLRLFPVRSAEKLLRSGVPVAAGTANAAMPIIAESYAASAEEAVQSAPGQPQAKARIVDGFVANKAWDASFVMAPPSAVALQNMVAEASKGEARGLGAPAAGIWSTLKTAPFTVGSGAPTMANDVPYRLEPRPALATKVIDAVQGSLRAEDPAPSVQQAEEDEGITPSGGRGDPAPRQAGLVSPQSATGATQSEQPPVELEYSEDTAWLPLLQQRSIENVDSAADGGPESSNAPSTDWETLQREMGTFCEANQGRAIELPPLDLEALRAELKLRRQQVEAYEEQEASRVAEMRDEQDRNFFELTSVANDFDVQLRAAVASSEDEGHSEEPQDYQNPASLASNSPEPPSLPMPAGEKMPARNLFERSASLESSGMESTQMRLLLQAEIEREKACQMFPSKARVRPWRTMAGKQTYRVAESTMVLPHSNDYLSLVQPPSLRNDANNSSSSSRVGSAKGPGSREDARRGRDEEGTAPPPPKEQRMREASVETEESEDPTEASGRRLKRNIFMPGMPANVRSVGSKHLKRRWRPKPRPNHGLLNIRRAATSDAAKKTGPKSGQVQLDRSPVWRCETPTSHAPEENHETLQMDEAGVLGWPPAMRPSKSSPALLIMRNRNSVSGAANKAGPRSIAGYKGFDVSPPPSSGKAAQELGFFDEAPDANVNVPSSHGERTGTGSSVLSRTGETLLASNLPQTLESRQFVYGTSREKWKPKTSRLGNMLRDRKNCAGATRQKKGSFVPPAGGVRGELTQRTGLRGVTQSDTL